MYHFPNGRLRGIHGWVTRLEMDRYRQVASGAGVQIRASSLESTNTKDLRISFLQVSTF